MLDAGTLNAWTLGFWTMGLWTTGRLDSERLDSGRLDTWIFGLWTLEPWTTERLDSGRLDAWTLGDWALDYWALGLCAGHSQLLQIFTGLYTERTFLKAVPRRCSVKMMFLKILQNSQENTYVRVSFLIKLQTESNNMVKTWHRCFPVNSAKFLRTHFITEWLRWLRFSEDDIFVRMSRMYLRKCAAYF